MDTIDLYILTVGFLIVGIPFFLVIGAGSFKYYIAKYGVETGQIQRFLDRLTFPFSLYKMPSNEIEEMLNGMKRENVTLSRFMPCVFPIGYVFYFFVNYVQQGFHDLSEFVTAAICFLIMLSPVFIMLNFGRNINKV